MVILMIFRGRVVTINSAFKSNYNRQTLTLTILSLSLTISPTKRLQDNWKNKIKSKVGGKIDSVGFPIFSVVKTFFFFFNQTSKVVTGYYLFTPPY